MQNHRRGIEYKSNAKSSNSCTCKGQCAQNKRRDEYVAVILNRFSIITFISNVISAIIAFGAGMSWLDMRLCTFEVDLAVLSTLASIFTWSISVCVIGSILWIVTPITGFDDD